MADDIIPVGIKFTATGLEAASAGLDKIAAAGPKVQAATDQIEAGAKKTGRSLEDLGGSAASASSPLERFAGSAVKAGAAYAALQVSSEILRSFYDLSRAVTTVQADLDKFRVAFEISGTAAQAVREFQFVKDAAKDLGLNFASAADGYRKFALAARDTAIEGDKARAIFTAVSKASSVMGLSAEESQGVFLALGQMISKGTVQAEELRGQLGERLPGAFQIASRAMGVTTAEMGKLLETGQVLADDFLPRFGAQLEKELGKKAADSANTAQGAINQLDSAWTQLKQTFAQAGAGDAAAGQLRILADGITRLGQDMQVAEAEGGGFFRTYIAGFTSLLGFLNPLNGLSYSVRDLNKQMEEGNKILANPKSGMYQRSSAAADVADAGEKLSKINSLLPYPDAFERGSTAEAAKQAAEMQAAATRMTASVKAFVGAKENLSTADQKLEKQTALLNKFAAAVKGVDNNSALFAEAQKALNVGMDKINKDFEKKLNPGASAAASKAKADAEAYAAAIAQGQKYNAVLQAEVDARRPLTEVERLSIELKEKEEELSRKHGASRLAEVKAIDAQRVALAGQIQQRKDQQAGEAALFASAIALQDAREKSVETLLAEAETVEAEVRSLKQQTEAIGVTGLALANLTNKRTEDLIVALRVKATTVDTTQEVDAINRIIKSLEEQKQARIDNAKATVSDEVTKQNAEDAKKVADDWQRAYEDIGRGLTDSLFRAAESGKGFFVGLRDSIKGLFTNLVIKGTLQFGATAALGGIGQAIGLGGANASGGAGLLGNIASLVSTGSSLNNAGGLVAGVGSYLTGAASTAAGVQGASALAIGAEAGALSGVGATAGAGLYTALAAIPVWGWVAMAAVAVAAIFTGDRGGPKGGGSFSTTGERLFTPDTADAMVTKIGDGLTSSITGILRDFGATATGLQYGIGFDTDPQGKADNRIASFLRDANGRSIFDNTGGRDIGRDEANISKEMQIETKRLMLAALQAVGPTLENGFGEIFARLDPATAAPEAIDNLFALASQLKALGDAAERLPGVMSTIADLSAVAREELIGLAGGIDSLTSGLQTYYQEFFTAEEQLANAGNNLRTDFAAIGLSFDALAADSDGPRQAFRDLFEGLDLTTVGGRQSAAALLALAPAVDSWIDTIDAAREAAREAARQSSASIDNAFLSESERFLQTFGQLGLAIPRTTAEFQDLVRAQDTTTEQGRTLIATLLSVYGGFRAVDQAARDATNAVIRQALETSRSTVTSEMDALTRANGDLTRTLFELENPIRTTAERFLELGQSMQETIDRMGQILGTGAVSLLDQLQARVNTRTAIAGARVGLAGQIQDQQIQGFSNRRDFRGGINFLKGIENALFAELQTTTDPAGVAGQITQALTTRYQFEASLIQQADDLRRDSLEKEIDRLEKLVDIADSLRDTIVDLQTGSLSALAPQAQVSVAANSFNSVLNRAQAGDVKALQALPGEATRFLTESQSFNASGGNYGAIFSNVISALDAVGVSLSDAPTQLGLAQSQLTATGTVVDNTGAMVVDLRKLDTALAARSTTETDAIAALVIAIKDQIAADERTREGIAIERGLAANRWSGLATTLESIDTSMSTLANNATLEGAR